MNDYLCVTETVNVAITFYCNVFLAHHLFHYMTIELHFTLFKSKTNPLTVPKNNGGRQKIDAL